MKITIKCSWLQVKHEEEVDVPDEELAGMTDDEQHDYIYKNYAQDVVNNSGFDVWWEIEEGADVATG